MRLLIIIISMISIGCGNPSLQAASTSNTDFYAKLFETRNTISDSDVELLLRCSAATTEWNKQTLEVVRGYTQIVSGKITPDQFVQSYGRYINSLPIIIQKMRMATYAMKNPEIASWHSGLFEIHQEMAAAYQEFKLSLERNDYTEADNAMNRLRAASEKKARYVASYANRLRMLAGDKNYDRYINGEMTNQSNRINN